MFRFALQLDDAIRAYPRLKEQGIVQDDFFGEQLYEKHLDGCTFFDIEKEIIFRWDSETPDNPDTALAIVLQACGMMPLCVWLNDQVFPMNCAYRRACSASRCGEKKAV